MLLAWQPYLENQWFKGINFTNFPGGLVVKNLPASAGDKGLIPDLGRFHMLWSN